MADYRTMVKKDVKRYIAENIDIEEYRGRRDDLEETLNDDLWTVDEVTGNGSGSYYFSSLKSRDAVLADMETVSEALREFCVSAETIGQKFLEEAWEYLDVTARCYVLGEAIGAALDEIESAGDLDEISEETATA